MKNIFIIILSTLIISFSVEVNSKENIGNKITAIITTNELQEALRRINTDTLKSLIKDKELRKKYSANLSAQKKLFERVEQQNINKNPDVLLGVFKEKVRIYIEALIEVEFKKSKEDFVELAKEIYDASPDKYFVARKIKVAQIYISKSRPNYEERLEKVKKALKLSKEKAVTFHDLAREYADGKYSENQVYAGFYDKWLIEPKDPSKLPDALIAAFKLKKVGDISDVVETDKAYHIIKLMADSPRRPLEFDFVKEDIIKDLRKKIWENKKSEMLHSFMLKDEDLNLNDTLLKQYLEKTLNQRREIETMQKSISQ